MNEKLFTNLAEARHSIEAWRIDFNTQRPHTSLQRLKRLDHPVARIRGERQGQRSPEVDGARMTWLEAQGFRVMRFWNNVSVR